MKKTILLLGFILPIYGLLLAQHSITGRVLDAQQQAIEFAIVQIHPLADSSQLRAAISTTDGYFTIENVPVDSYQVVVQMLGHLDWEQVLFLDQPLTIDILLMEDATTLSTIEVVAQQSYLESRLGKKVLVIGKDLAQSGSSAMEALEQIPSVSTTERGGLQIRGSSNIIIYINGKETRRQVSSLQHIPAEMLERVEIINNPAAQYDAEGVGGIINLVYKKVHKAKWALESHLVTALPGRLRGGLNSRWTKANFTAFINASLGRGWYENREGSLRDFPTGDVRQYRHDIDYDGNEYRRIIDAGLSFEPDSSLAFSLEWNYNRWDDREKADQLNRWWYRSTDSLLQIGQSSQVNELEDESTLSASMQKSWAKAHQLQVLFSVGGEDENNSFERSSNEEVPLDWDNFFLQQSNTKEKQRLFQGKVDYQIPIRKWGSIESGIKVDYIEYHIFQQVLLQDDNLVVPDNDFSMDLQKYAAYLVQKLQIHRLEYAIGLRAEQFYSHAIQRSNDMRFEQEYFQVFPSVQLLYHLSDTDHSLGFNYTRRINRPGFFDLNPYVSYRDPLNLEQGNPDLAPEFAHLYDLNYHKNWPQFNLDISCYHRQTQNAIQALVRNLNATQSLETYANFAERIDQGIEGQLDYRYKKHKSSLGFNLSRNQFKDTEQAIFFQDQRSWSLRFQQRLKLPKQWIIDASAVYQAPVFEAQQKRLAIHYMDLAISKKFHNKRSSVTLSCRDIFNTRIYRYQLRSDEVRIEKQYKWQTRRLILAWRYRLLGDG